MKKEFKVPGTPYYFQTVVHPGQIINPIKYWRRYLNGRNSPLHVGKVNFKGQVEVIK